MMEPSVIGVMEPVENCPKRVSTNGQIISNQITAFHLTFTSADFGVLKVEDSWVANMGFG